VPGGANGKGGGIGPRLAELPTSIARVKAQTGVGGGTMPAGLVKGQDEEDALAYVATIVMLPRRGETWSPCAAPKR
jgi:hypothetical protein